MSILATILQLLDEQGLAVNKTAVIIELSDSRLATLLLRRSSIWRYALPENPHVMPEWGQYWRNLTAPATATDIDEWKTVGQNFGGVSIMPKLEEYFTQTAPDQPPTVALPVGELSVTPALTTALQKRLPTTTCLPAQAGLTLPTNLDYTSVRQAIAALYPPALDADYTLQTTCLDEERQELTLTPFHLARKGEPPPTPPGKEIRLFRAIGRNGMPNTPVNLVIHKNGQTLAQAGQIQPAKNIFHLHYWFNYNDDQLRIRATEPAPAATPIKLLPLPPRQAEALPLPALKTSRSLDMVFIVDGTMRRLIGGDAWKPDLTLAKTLITTLVQQLGSEPDLDAQTALCLYGDWPHSGQADYDLRLFGMQPPEKLFRLIEQGTQWKATPDRDYEALLEMALRRSRTGVAWRQHAAKFALVIGYAPPHPHQSQPLYPKDSGLRHEPFTSGINWRQELHLLRQQGVTVLSVWTPYPLYDPTHDTPCLTYSREVWREIAGSDDFFTLPPTADGAPNTISQEILSQIRAVASHYVAQGSINIPLTRQIHHLRWETALKGADQ